MIDTISCLHMFSLAQQVVCFVEVKGWIMVAMPVIWCLEKYSCYFHDWCSLPGVGVEPEAGAWLYTAVRPARCLVLCVAYLVLV